MHKLSVILDKGTRKHMATNESQGSCNMYMTDTVCIVQKVSSDDD